MPEFTQLSEVTPKIKQLEIEGGEGARAPVPHSWRRQCTQRTRKNAVSVRSPKDTRYDVLPVRIHQGNDIENRALQRSP